jgi:hypothetical protein
MNNKWLLFSLLFIACTAPIADERQTSPQLTVMQLNAACVASINTAHTCDIDTTTTPLSYKGSDCKACNARVRLMSQVFGGQ